MPENTLFYNYEKDPRPDPTERSHAGEVPGPGDPARLSRTRQGIRPVRTPEGRGVGQGRFLGHPGQAIPDPSLARMTDLRIARSA